MDYFSVLGLEKEPFSTSPDPLFFYQSVQHKAILANLLIELRLRRGLSIVFGDIGTGKTTMSRKLVQLLKEREGFFFRIILDPGGKGEKSFLNLLAENFSISLKSSRPTLLELKKFMEGFLFKKGVEENQTVVLIVDEAQKLDKVSLECLRTLLNYETNEFKLLQLVLFGQVELYHKLVNMPNFFDRISFVSTLKPFEQEPLGEMIEFRLRQAGYKKSEPLFSTEAVAKIHQFTQGYLRQTALICHKALKRLVINNQLIINEQLLEEIINEEVRINWPQTQETMRNFPLLKKGF